MGYHQELSMARSNVFVLSANSGNCSAYKLLIILCSASWTWALHMHWLVLSKNARVPQSFFWSFFSSYFFPVWNFAVQSQHTPPRFLYPQLSKALGLCFDSLFLCPWLKKLQPSRKLGWLYANLFCFISLKVHYLFCLLYNAWNQLIHISCSAI